MSPHEIKAQLPDLVWFGLLCFGSSHPHLALRESGYPSSRCPGPISQPNKTERPYLTYESGFLSLHSFGGKRIRRRRDPRP